MEFENRPVDEILEKELQVLNKHFKTVKLEKYTDANMRFLYKEAYEQIVGNSNKKKISKRKMNKIRNYLVSKLQSRYGPYANILYSKILDDGSVKSRVNINHVYKTEFGRLYSGYFTFAFGLLLTTHSIERFEQRFENKEQLKINLLKEPFYHHTNNATTLDIMLFLLLKPRGYFIENDFIFLLCKSKKINGAVIFVLKKLENVFIVKTTLATSMIKNNQMWNEIDYQGNNLREYLLQQLKEVS